MEGGRGSGGVGFVGGGMGEASLKGRGVGGLVARGEGRVVGAGKHEMGRVKA